MCVGVWVLKKRFLKKKHLNFYFIAKNTLFYILSNDFQTDVPTEWYTYST